MSDFDRNVATARTGYRTDQVAIDAGLRAYMIRVYNYMTAGVALTGLVAWFAYQAAGGDSIAIVGNSITGLTGFGHAIFGSPLMWLFVLAPLGFVMVLSFGINRLSAGTALTLFFVYVGLLGIVAGDHLPRLYRSVDHTGVLHLGGDRSAPEPLRLHHQARSDRRSAHSCSWA